jgi:hypothetical protein
MTAAVIPDVEPDLFTTTIDRAVSRADRGDLVGGHDELLYGLQRAEAAREDGEAWGAELVGQWERTLERFKRKRSFSRKDAAHVPPDE